MTHVLGRIKKIEQVEIGIRFEWRGRLLAAYSVFKVLVERYGIDSVRLQPLGRGPLEPMPGVAPSDGMNRRVQFRIDG